MPNEKDFALVIGVNDYKTLKQLNGPVSDATHFSSWLTSPAGGDLPPANCKLIPSQPDSLRPIQDEIDDALEEIILKDDGSLRRFYFFFAGHGIGITWDANGLCLPKWSDIQRNYALSSKGYLNYIVESSIFPEIYFFMDCCRTRAVNANPSNTRLNNIRPRGAGISSIVVYATPFENTAGEGADSTSDDQSVRGYFSQALIEGLEGAAANAAGAITAASLIDFSRRRTEELALAGGKVQVINTQIGDGGKRPEELVLKAGGTPVVYELNVHFNISGTMRLSGPDLSTIKEAPVNNGDNWAAIQINKGIYSLTETGTGAKRFLEIDGAPREITYEFS